jgi:hypothetical protein
MADDYLRVSYSSLNLLDSCARKFEFNKLFPRRARDFDTFAADVGTALHRGYQTYLMTRDESKAMWALMQEYPYEAEWNQTVDVRGLQAAVVTLEEMIVSEGMKEWEVAEIKRPNTADEIKSGLTGGVVVPAIEVPFELRLKGLTLPDGRGIAFTGFIDAFLRNTMADDLFRSMDIKTHRRTTRDATAKYKYDSQQVPYGVVLEHIQGKPITEFEVMYLDTFVDLAEPWIEPYHYMKTADDIQEWLLNTVMKCQRIQRFMEMDYFPRTDGGCMSFFRPCFFLDICETRNRKSIEAWLLEGEAAEHRVESEPWVTAEIEVYGEAA